MMTRIPPKQGVSSDAKAYDKIQWASAVEMIHAFYVYEYYDYSLYNALNYLSENPNDEFLKTSVTLSTAALYQAMKDHELADYISNYSEDNMASFNDMLFMLNNIRLSDLGSFVNCVYENKVAPIKENEFTIAAGYCNSKTIEDGKISEWQAKYKSGYKDGRFKYLLDVNPKAETKKKKKK